MVTRFGRFVRITGPGPHGRLPFGIEQRSEGAGGAAAQAGVRLPHRRTPASESSFRRTRRPPAESVMLTGDLNVATVEWIVQYKITDPYKYLFKLRDVERDVPPDVRGDDAHRWSATTASPSFSTVGREAIAAKAKELLSAALPAATTTASCVQQLVLQDVDPPEPVKPSFNEVNQAIQERERAINEAWAEYNQEIPRPAAGPSRRCRRRGLRRRPREPGPGRRPALRRAPRAVPEGARGDPNAPLPRDHVRRAARGRQASWSSTRRPGGSCRLFQLGATRPRPRS